MGIQLDWQIESDQQQRRAVEDPHIRQQRRRQWRLLLGTILVVACVVGSVAALVLWRLQQYDTQLREALFDTVDAEVRALRVGDESAYMAIRRTSSTYWLGRQSEIFAAYQQDKRSGQLEITGDIVDYDIDQNTDRTRARVIVEEIYKGEPHYVVWFYWYYESDPNGWRRLPPDTEYWGDDMTLETERVTVEYHELDKAFAEAVFEQVDMWWQIGCDSLACVDGLPPLTIEIEPRPAAAPEWDLSAEWTILVASPLYDGRMSRDYPMSPQFAQQLAQLIAKRVVDHNLVATAGFDSTLAFHQTTPYADSTWLWSEYVTWLVGRFLGASSGSTFLDSLAVIYGDITPPLLLRSLTIDAPIGTLIESATGLPVASMTLDVLNAIDWRTYFATRLTFESHLLRDGFGLVDEQQRVARHNELYDENDANALAIADTNRANFDTQRPAFTVSSVDIVLDTFNRPQATVQAVSYADQPPQYVVFRWDGYTWKRVG